MNAGQLIEELKRYPAHVPVWVVLSNIIYQDSEMPLADCDALEAENVQFHGTHILVQSK